MNENKKVSKKSAYLQEIEDWRKKRIAEEREKRIKSLIDQLPHGSGINGKWVVERFKKQVDTFFCHNTFDAMDQMGGYCHYYDFTAIIHRDWTRVPTGETKFSLVRIEFNGDQRPERHACCGYGLKDYLKDDIAGLLEMGQMNIDKDVAKAVSFVVETAMMFLLKKASFHDLKKAIRDNRRQLTLFIGLCDEAQ